MPFARKHPAIGRSVAWQNIGMVTVKPNGPAAGDAGTMAQRSSAGGCSLSPHSLRTAQVCPLGDLLSFRCGCKLLLVNISRNAAGPVAEEELEDLLQRLLDKLETTPDKVRRG